MENGAATQLGTDAARPPNPTTEAFRVTAADGFQLAAARWLPAGPVRAVLQVSHGMAEHKQRYASFARMCAEAGFAVYAHDHRGHGASIDASTPHGHYADHDGWNKVVGDLHAVLSQARAAHPGVPAFLFGHSMGSFIARAYLVAQGASLAGAIISATGFRLGLANLALQRVARREVQKHGPRAPSQLMGKLVFGAFNLQFAPTRAPYAPGDRSTAVEQLVYRTLNVRLAALRTRFEWLSRDPACVDAYVADALCGFDCSGQLWSDLLGGVFAVERAEADPRRLPRVPLLAIAGTRDPVSMGGLGTSQLARRYRAAGATDVTDRRYPDGRHELLNETNRTEVWADLLSWMNARR